MLSSANYVEWEVGDLVRPGDCTDWIAEVVRKADPKAERHPVARLLVNTISKFLEDKGHECYTRMAVKGAAALRHAITDDKGLARGWYLLGRDTKLSLADYLLHKQAIQDAQAKFPPLRKS